MWKKRNSMAGKRTLVPACAWWINSVNWLQGDVILRRFIFHYWKENISRVLSTKLYQWLKYKCNYMHWDSQNRALNQTNKYYAQRKNCICLNLTQGDGSQNLFLYFFPKLSSHIRCNETGSHCVDLSMKGRIKILITLTSD